MKTINITDGVNLRLIDGRKFTHTTLSILFRQEISKESVTANSLLALMFLSGSSHYKNKRMIEIKLEEMESAVLDTSVIKKGNEHIIQIYSRFRPCYTDDIFSLLSDIIFKPLFGNEYIEKNNLKNIIEGQINNKREYAFNRFMESIYGDINGDGYTDDIKNINIDRHYKNVINNSNIEIMAVCQNGNTIELAARKYLKFQPRKNQIISEKKLKPVKYRFTEERDVVQGKLCVGIDCDFQPKGVDYAKLLIANDVFGSGSSSRLFMEAREKENLCYYITSRIFRFSSLIAVEAGIDSKNMNRTVDIIKKAISSMQNDNSDIELSKKNIINNYKTALDKPDALLNIYMNQIMADDDRSIDDVIECINSVDTIEGVFDGFKTDTVYMLRGEI